ncbi:hypothetical protein CVT24_012565 [Panaeolus cyanescens]|uniref:Uncharacterized protein n=1 Tax=Panaeolus cyanescens TaxID=181874 RepID=A0A409WKR0_9AGAR|nr:hypothetical protein CVT24_012565 [Panaeolus cyanescens]
MIHPIQLLSIETIITILEYCILIDSTSTSTCSSPSTTPTESTLSKASLLTRSFYNHSRAILFHSPIIRIPIRGSPSSPGIVYDTPPMRELLDIITANPAIVRSFRNLEIRFQSPSKTMYTAPSLIKSTNESEVPLISILNHISNNASLLSVSIRGVPPCPVLYVHDDVSIKPVAVFDTVRFGGLPVDLRGAIGRILGMKTLKRFCVRNLVDFPVEEMLGVGKDEDSRDGEEEEGNAMMRRLCGMDETRRIEVYLEYVSSPPHPTAPPAVTSSSTLVESGATDLQPQTHANTMPRIIIEELHIHQHPYEWRNLTQTISRSIPNDHDSSSTIKVPPSSVIPGFFSSLRHLSFTIPKVEDNIIEMLLKECGTSLESLDITCGRSSTYHSISST